LETSSCGFCGTGRVEGAVVVICPGGRAGWRGIISGCGGALRASAAGGAGLFVGGLAAATASSGDRAGVGAAAVLADALDGVPSSRWAPE
jgi:hypothetical protein